MSSTNLNLLQRRDIISLYNETDQSVDKEIQVYESVQDHISTIKQQVDFLVSLVEQQWVPTEKCEKTDCVELRNAVLNTGRNCIQQIKKLKEEQKQQEEKLQDLQSKAYYDNLTGLPNRHYLSEIFNKIVPQFINKNRNYSIAILDIDHFKQINDSYGHEIWDIILKHFAQTLSVYFKDSKKDIIARLWWEEFIIVSSRSVSNLHKEIECLLKWVQKNGYSLWEENINYSFSWWISTMGVGNHGNQQEKIIFKVLRDADGKLYEAKQAGRSQIHS